MNYYYNPYMNNPYLQQYQMQPQYNNQLQSQFQQQPQQQNNLNGQMVDSIEGVKAKDVDLSGNPVFYPNVNGNEIYKKQLMQDGTSRILTYKLQVEETSQQNKIPQQDLTDILNNMKKEIIEEIRGMLS